MAIMAKDSHAGLVCQDQLEIDYDNEEEHNNPITIRFTNTLPALLHLNPDTHTTDTNNQNLSQTTNSMDNLDNTGNIDPENITIRITGVNYQASNKKMFQY